LPTYNTNIPSDTGELSLVGTHLSEAVTPKCVLFMGFKRCFLFSYRKDQICNAYGKIFSTAV